MNLKNRLRHLVLADAILSEEECAEFYRQAAALAPDDASRKLLAELAAEEEKHLQHLRDELGEEHAPKAKPRRALDEAPGGDPLAAKNLLEKALGREKATVQFYKLLAKRVPIRAAKEALLSLAEEERSHCERIERALAAMPELGKPENEEGEN